MKEKDIQSFLYEEQTAWSFENIPVYHDKKNIHTKIFFL